MKRAHRLRGALAGLLAAGALLGPLAGCSEPSAPVAPFQRLGRRAAHHLGAARRGRRAGGRRPALGPCRPARPRPRPPAGRAGARLPFVVDRVPVRCEEWSS